jgi:exopolysaccharide biosynthesis polyprenyl glycosylphosphotransferase
MLRSVRLLSDMLITVFAFFAAYHLRTTILQQFFKRRILGLDYHYWLVFVIIPVWAAIFAASKRYRYPRRRSLWREIFVLALDLLVGWAVITAVIFMVKAHLYSRSLLLLFVVADFILLALSLLLGRALGRHFRRLTSLRKILIVGTPQRTGEFLEAMEPHNPFGLECVGVLRVDGQEPETGDSPLPILGNVTEIAEILDKKQVDSVVFAVPIGRVTELSSAIEVCEETGTKIYMDLEIGGLSFSKGHAEYMGDKPLLTFTSAPHNTWALAAKRVLDFIGAAVLLLLLSPVLLIASLLVKLTSRGPVLFVQRRSGLYGREFNMMKFRTMVVDAEKRREEVSTLNEMSGPVFKIKNDPRLTRVGRWLRKLSIDELPQLLNVIRGSMSLVGPRPLPVEESQRLPERWQRRRLSMKPGLTCLWQVRGRSSVDFDDWMKLDIDYIDNWSFMSDLKILLLTIPVVLFGKGAQ